MKGLLAATLTTVAVAVGLVGDAGAATNHCGDYGTDNGRFFTGVTVTPSGSNYFEGAYAEITARAVDLCSSNFTESPVSFAWVMLQKPGGYGYAQAGYVKYYGGNVRMFTEWRRDAQHSFVDLYWGQPNFGDVHKFKVVRENPAACQSQTGYCLAMYVDGDRKDLTTFDDEGTWNSNFAFFSGEVNYGGSDVMGSSADARFDSVQEMNGSGWNSHGWSAYVECSSNYTKQTITQDVTWDLHNVNGHDNQCP